jgi:hypothetical protein
LRRKCLLLTQSGHTPVTSRSVARLFTTHHVSGPEKMNLQSGSLPAHGLEASDLRALARLSGELTRSEAYLEEAQSLSHTGSFGWRVSTGEIVWSKESFRIFGYDKSLAVTLDMVIQRAHPEDRVLVQRTLERHPRRGRISIMNIDC